VKYLLDTNVCVHVLRHPSGIVANRFFAVRASDMAISIVTKAELLVGPLRKKSRDDEYAKVTRFIDMLPILPFDGSVVDQFASIAARLLDIGKPGDGLDLQIAATAMYYDLILVTHNTRDFAHIDGIRLEDWQNGN